MVAQGCVLLFGLPFALGGVFSLVQAVRLYQSGKTTDALVAGAVGLVFSLVGFGLVAASGKARKSAAAKAARVAAAPDQPWLWREDWASRRIEDRNRSASLGLWFFAVLWNLISFPATVVALSHRIDGDHNAIWLVLLFPLVGLGLLAAAIHASIRARRFGDSVLELVAVPAPVGREIAGRIRVPHAFEPKQGISLTLTCSRVVTRQSGKSTSTTSTILWQDESQIPGVARDGAGASIPFLIAIPSDAQPTDETNSRDKVIWQLAATAVLAGVDYASAFEVPVFRTAESEQPQPAELIAREQKEIAEYRVPANAPFRVVERAGVIEVEFPMGRNPGVATGITLFSLIWSAVVVLLWYAPAPLLFRLVFSGFELLLIYLVLSAWLGHSRLRADSSGLTVDSGIGPWHSRSQFAPGEIVAIIPRVGMTAGSKAYYDLRLTFSDGSERTAAGGLRDLRSAEWLAGRLLGKVRGEQ